jgi:glyoxylase-like metal-dependent hydrolase (beta-lactamase superfamily II)
MSRFAIPKMANAYILDGDILVEPCVQDHQRMTDWYGLFASWPLRFRAVFLTHRHLDHSKGVDLIAQRLGTPVIGPGHTGEAHGWTILQTPGHAPDHICFWNGVTLIAGDMLYDTEPALVPAEGGDLEAYRGSTAMLRSLRPKLLLPGHGRPNFNPDAALARAEELVLNAQ